jgi:transcriptional regulator with XRE-family HTH domain
MVTDHVLIKPKPIETVLMQDIHAVFCSNLKRIRKAKGLTQQDMADKLKIKNVQTYQEIEYGYLKGLAWPRPDRIKQLAKALKCKPTDFFKEH